MRLQLPVPLREGATNPTLTQETPSHGRTRPLQTPSRPRVRHRRHRTHEKTTTPRQTNLRLQHPHHQVQPHRTRPTRLLRKGKYSFLASQEPAPARTTSSAQPPRTQHRFHRARLRVQLRRPQPPPPTLRSQTCVHRITDRTAFPGQLRHPRTRIGLQTPRQRSHQQPRGQCRFLRHRRGGPIASCLADGLQRIRPLGKQRRRGHQPRPLLRCPATRLRYLNGRTLHPRPHQPQLPHHRPLPHRKRHTDRAPPLQQQHDLPQFRPDHPAVGPIKIRTDLRVQLPGQRRLPLPRPQPPRPLLRGRFRLGSTTDIRHREHLCTRIDQTPRTPHPAHRVQQ